jgi:hypothetical protein
MTTNFNITDNHALRIHDRLIDLHNNFDLVGFTYDASARQFEIKWTLASGDWLKSDEVNEVVLTHKHVSYLTITDRDQESGIEEDKCLAEISFFPSKDRDVNGSVISQAEPTSVDDILYFFENGQLIRLCCDTIELKYK